MSATRTIVGLDFGTYSIKAVWLEKRAEGVAIVQNEELQVPPETQDPIRFIQPWLEKHGLLKTLSAAAIPGTQTVFQPVVLPADDPRGEGEAASNEVAAFTEMAGEAMHYGASAVPMEDGSRVLQIALVRPGVVESGLRGGAAFSLRLCDLVPSPVAVFNGAVSQAGEADRPTLFVSVGHQTTDLAIGSAKGLLFARSFAIGGKAFTDAIARERKVSDLQAERLKKTEAGLEEGNAFAEVLRPVATLWISQVRSALSVFRGQFQDPRLHPSHAVFLGGGTRLSGFESFAAEGLALLPSQVAMGLGGATLSPIFATAYGLALSGAHVGCCPITLFPEDLRNEIIFREKKPYWIAAGIFAALILGTFIAIAVRGIARERAVVEVETQRIRKLEAIDNNIQRMRAETETLRATAEPVRALLEAGPQVRELVRLLAGSIHPEDWITMVSDEALYNASEMPEVESKDPGVRTPTPKKKGMPARSPLKIGGAPAVTRSASVASSKPQTKLAPKGGKGKNASQSVESAKPAEVVPTFSVFIVEGYTPQTDLSSVKMLVKKLSESPLVNRADTLGAERVLPPMPLGEEGPAESITAKYARFVLRVEVKPLEETLTK